MPQNFEQKYPNNGMNQDDENRHIGESDSRYILNLRAGTSESENVGGVENIKGTTEVLFNLPAGRNKCIGSEGDQTTHSNFFFIWNSLGDHSIYRYLPETRTIRLLVKDSKLNFSEHDLINDINIIDDMIKWRDINNPPRKINWKKADTENPDFRQVFNWYLGDQYLDSETSLTLQFEKKADKYSTTSQTYSVNLSLNASLTDKAEIAADLTSSLNAYFSATSALDLVADSCGDFVTITATTNDFYISKSFKSGNEVSQIVPQNHYQTFSVRTIDAIKHPAHCELVATFETDATFNRNYVEKKVFQFASRYIYDDDEKTTVNPHSIHVYNKYICEQFSGNNLNNYIKIDFSVLPELLEADALQTIKRLELYVREGEEGIWRTIKVLDQEEFIDTSDQHYNFYNNGIYTAEDQVNFVRPFDLVPQRTKNQEVVKNRTFYANNLEGYDNTCVDANIDVTYDDVESRIKPTTYTISGRIDIRAAFNGGSSGALKDHQPIWRDVVGGGTTDGDPTVSPIVFGGLNSFNNLPDPTLQNIATKTGQELPLGGFVVYLAGTDYYAISKQKPGSYSGKSDVGQDTSGVFQGSGGSYVDHVREYVTEEGDFGELYSTFDIPNVPNGWYSLRVASHLTTQADLDSGTREYQRTSTNVFQITSQQGFGEERTGIHEILIHVQNGNMTDYHIDIMDVSHAITIFGDFQKGASKIYNGYLAANDISASTIDYPVALSDTRMAGSLMKFNLGADSVKINTITLGLVAGRQVNDWAENYWLDYGDTQRDADGIPRRKINRTITDHNGYYFFASMQVSGTFPNLGGLSVDGAEAYRAPNTAYSYTNYSSGLGSGKTSDVDPGEFTNIATRASGDINSNRVWVQGNIQDQNGLGIPKASVISNRAIPHQTDGDGDYGFWHFGQYDYQDNSFNQTTFVANTVLFPSQSGNVCSAIYTEQLYDFGYDYPTYYTNNILASVPNVTKTSVPITITLPNLIGDPTGMITINTNKRGGDWKYGIEYTDRGMRGGAVNTSEKLQLHIPYYSEKDKNGLIQVGVPYLNWEVKHRPPGWATHWQWIRTRNLTVGSYFQWSLEDVRYEDDAGNPSTFASGTRVVLDWSNLQRYLNRYPSMDLEMSIDAITTRVRFAKNSSGAYYQDYYDFKVLSVNGGEVTIEKDFSMGKLEKGVLVEFYNEILDIEEDIYYEFGECFEVGTDSYGNKYHKGLSQDQDPINPTTTPATGIFRTGDAYYRLRNFFNVSTNNPSLIDDDAASDLYSSEIESIGRPNGVNPDAAQLWKPNQIRNSLKYIPDSKINGFSTFYSDDFQPLPIEYGDINKLQLAANVLMSIHEFRWVSNYVEEVITRKQGGGDDLLATTDVFGSFRSAKEIAGTINQESVVEYKGNIYAFDKNKGIVNRWGADGLTAISSYKMTDFFSDKAKAILNNENRTGHTNHILGIYDSKFHEYILSFGELNSFIETYPTGDLPSSIVSVPIDNSLTLADGTSDTLYTIESTKKEGSNLIFDKSATPLLDNVQIDNRVDSKGDLIIKTIDSNGLIEEVVKLGAGQGIEGLNLTTGKFVVKSGGSNDKTIIPPTGGTILVQGETIAFSEKLKKWVTFYSFRPEMFGIIDLEMIAFVNGGCWIHNDSDTRNNFYGIQYTSQLETIFNSLPNEVKVFQSVGAESHHIWTVPSAKTKSMETEMVAARFKKIEDSYFASVMRDKNDPTFASQPTIEAIINGRPLRDRTIKVKFENNETVEVVLFSVSMLGTISQRHNK